METDTIEDPYLQFQPLYGAGEEGCEAVPTHHMIGAHRQAFHESRVHTVQKSFKKANSKRGQTIKQFGKWRQEPKSMIYVVTSVSSSRALATPICAEVGLYQGWEHLQKVSLNSASSDILQTDRDGNNDPYSYAAQLKFGDLLVVLEIGRYKPGHYDEYVPTVTKYFVVERNVECGMSLVVKEDNEYLVYKSYQDLSFPPCKLTEAKLREKLHPAPNLPTAHLPSIFIINADIFQPYNKCYRFGLNFNRNAKNQSLVRKFLVDVSSLTCNKVENYVPYIPHYELLSGSFYTTLERSLMSPNPVAIMHGLKCLRGAKLQSSTSVLTDRRFAKFSTYGSSFSPDGTIHVNLRTNAAVSFKSLTPGSYVEVECGFKTPLIAYVSNLQCSKGVKTMGLVFEYESGYVENSDPLGPNIVNNHPDWQEIRKVLTTKGTFSVRSFDVASSWDNLISSEKRYYKTQLGDVLLNGMARAAAEVNHGKVTIRHAEHYDGVYETGEDQPHTLSPGQLDCYATAIGKPPSPEQLKICSLFLDPTVYFHYAEACFGSGKTKTAVASGVTYVSDNPNVRIAFLAETNAAVNALVDAANLGSFFNPRNYHLMVVRPIIMQSKNWKTKKGLQEQPFDHKIVMNHVFVTELETTNPSMAYGPAQTNLKSMFSWVCAHHITTIGDVLPPWKIAALQEMDVPCLNEDEIYHLFLEYYRPNMFFATCDMFAGYASSFVLPTRFFPTMIVLDESTMVQPSDLTTFTSKMRREEVPVEIRYFLFGDMKQLEPFNTIRTLAPILKSPNELLLDSGFLPSRLTRVYRSHPELVRILSTVFYSGRLTPGRSPEEDYIQYNLPDDLFPGRNLALHFQFNTHKSKRVVQSRANYGEIEEVAAYAYKLISRQIPPAKIVVLTPFTAQRYLLRKSLPQGVNVYTTRKFQGGEADIVLFSACNSGNLDNSFDGGMEEVEESARVLTTSSKVGFVADPSIILVSLSRSRQFTTVFGSKEFLSSIPQWRQIIDLAGYA